MVLARVEGRAVLAPSLLAVVEAAGELADDEDVDALGTNRPEVREDAELLAEAKQALLGADGGSLELRRADGGEKHRVGDAARGERLGRQRVARLRIRSAEGTLLEIERERQCAEGRIASRMTSGPMPSPSGRRPSAHLLSPPVVP